MSDEEILRAEEVVNVAVTAAKCDCCEDVTVGLLFLLDNGAELGLQLPEFVASSLALAIRATLRAPEQKMTDGATTVEFRWVV